MFKRAATIIIQKRGVKTDLKIKWIKPEYVPAYKPEKSGDLEGLQNVDDYTIAPKFKECEELNDASKEVKKLFSVGHQGHKETAQVVVSELVDRVKRHKYDQSSAESYIALLTARIRLLQEHMELNPRDAKNKQLVQELIDKRKKRLKYLRNYDYRKFEWLLEKLNIEYKAHPESFHKLTRRESLRRLTELHCEEIRMKKFDEYKNLLESQQGPFLKEKLEALKTIRSEQIDLKLEVTVSEQDIARVEESLKQWTLKEEIKQKALKKKKQK